MNLMSRDITTELTSDRNNTGGVISSLTVGSTVDRSVSGMISFGVILLLLVAYPVATDYINAGSGVDGGVFGSSNDGVFPGNNQLNGINSDDTAASNVNIGGGNIADSFGPRRPISSHRRCPTVYVTITQTKFSYETRTRAVTRAVVTDTTNYITKTVTRHTPTTITDRVTVVVGGGQRYQKVGFNKISTHLLTRNQFVPVYVTSTGHTTHIDTINTYSRVTVTRETMLTRYVTVTKDTTVIRTETRTAIARTQVTAISTAYTTLTKFTETTLTYTSVQPTKTTTVVDVVETSTVTVCSPTATITQTQTALPAVQQGGFTAGQSAQFGQTSAQFGQQPSQFGQQSGQFGQQSGQFGQQSGQFGKQSGQFGQQSGQFGQQSGQFGQQSAQFGQQSTGNSQQQQQQNQQQSGSNFGSSGTSFFNKIRYSQW